MRDVPNIYAPPVSGSWSSSPSSLNRSMSPSYQSRSRQKRRWKSLTAQSAKNRLNSAYGSSFPTSLAASLPNWPAKQLGQPRFSTIRTSRHGAVHLFAHWAMVSSCLNWTSSCISSEFGNCVDFKCPELENYEDSLSSESNLSNCRT